MRHITLVLVGCGIVLFINRKFTELRYTFHWIYVGILDTVTTATIQLFGSHERFVLIGARCSPTERIFVPKTLKSYSVERLVLQLTLPRFAERLKSSERDVYPTKVKLV